LFAVAGTAGFGLLEVVALISLRYITVQWAAGDWVLMSCLAPVMRQSILVHRVCEDVSLEWRFPIFPILVATLSDAVSIF
jgi:hypothetical protein